ncbi:hypothetical protein ACPVPU_07155 [Sphingomonas sp. CJ99]
MIYIWLNIGPIAAAMLAGLAIGLVWTRAVATPVPGIRQSLVAAIALFWLAAILAGALILAPARAAPWIMALGSAFVIWIGFVVPVLAVSLSALRIPARTVVSVAGYWLVTMIVQAALMTATGLTPPPQ